MTRRSDSGPVDVAEHPAENPLLIERVRSHINVMFDVLQFSVDNSEWGTSDWQEDVDFHRQSDGRYYQWSRTVTEIRRINSHQYGLYGATEICAITEKIAIKLGMDILRDMVHAMQDASWDIDESNPDAFMVEMSHGGTENVHDIINRCKNFVAEIELSHN